MLNEISHKSSGAATTDGRRQHRLLPVYGLVGLAVMIAGEVLLFGGVAWVKQWFTPIMWTGYILVIDAVIRRRKGTSLLSDHPREFFFLAIISIGSWTIFEGYNVLLKNWTYIGLPDNLFVRYAGYAWSFATITPVMLVTYEVLDSILPGAGPGDSPRAPAATPVRSAEFSSGSSRSPRLPNGVFYSFVVFGLASLIIPFIWPSIYMTPIVWVGFAFLLDPINGRLGERSFLSEFFTGRFRSMLIMFLAGLICGILWEFWNYWATTKWQYDVPYMGHIKIFEMPVLGFLGFLPFAVESYAIYVFVRRLIPIKRTVRYLG
ncbi:MAG: hypothetical protein V3V49_05010 [Candidatus Krumholzibacteria bacterium]